MIGNLKTLFLKKRSSTLKLLSLRFDGKEALLELDQKQIYAQNIKTREKFNTENGKLFLPIEFSQEKKLSNYFQIFEKEDQCLGEIELLAHSSASQKTKEDIPPFIGIGKCTLEFPKSKNIIFSPDNLHFSLVEKEEIKKEINFWNRDSERIFAMENTPDAIIKKCHLIVQFIWSLDPLCRFSDNSLDMSLSDRIDGLKEKKLGMVCGGIRNLFIDLTNILIHELNFRRVHGFQCHYPSLPDVSHTTVPNKGIVIASHCLTEVKIGRKWMVIDPYFRCYFTDKKGRFLSAEKIQLLKKQHRLRDIQIHHFKVEIHSETLDQILGFFNSKTIYNSYSDDYFVFFNWLNFQDVH